MKAEEIGTLYQWFHVSGDCLNSVSLLLIKWPGSRGSFETLRDIVGARYELVLDDRLPSEMRYGKPGYLVMGKKYPQQDVEVVGIFVPEETEEEVVKKLSEDLKCSVALIRINLRDLKGRNPCVYVDVPRVPWIFR